MKKIIALLLVLVMLLGLAACSNKAKYAYGNVYALSNVLEGSVEKLYSDEELISSTTVSAAELVKYEADRKYIINEAGVTGMIFSYAFESDSELEEILVNYYKALRVNEDWVPIWLTSSLFMGTVIKGDDVYYVTCRITDGENLISVMVSDQSIFSGF